MLTIYRRHLRNCPHLSKGRSWKNCRCPIWAAGRLGSDQVNQSLDTASCEAAQFKVRNMETDALLPKQNPPLEVTVKSAIESFMQDAKARRLTPSTLAKFRVLL